MAAQLITDALVIGDLPTGQTRRPAESLIAAANTPVSSFSD
jgi:hypothetical protein